MTSAILLAVLLLFINKILFAIEALICSILDILYASFEVFSGISPVVFKDNHSYLIDVFFSNDIVSAVYWGMACIGFALTFGFAIVALIRKVFDSSGEKVKATIGMILTNVFKAILLILLMTALVSATINATCVLMQQVDYLFNNAQEYADPSSITFDDTDFANMFNVMNTIGNYSLNPSYNNRFNINSCYNAIRPYMQNLAKQRTFDFSYEGAEGSWQYALLQIYNAAEISSDVDIDSYNEVLQNSILDIMYKINTGSDFKPLKYYQRTYGYENLGAQLGRIVMLSGSMDAANNGDYNVHPSMTDELRRPYYLGSKDVYDYDTVSDDFDVSLTSWNHLVILVAGYFLIKEFAIILFNCVARMFNIILLYLMAPLFISVMPLDDGGKMKQWTTAFIIQSLSIFGSIVAVRLLMIFIPLVMSSDLVLFQNGVWDFISKLILVLGICVTSEKANGLIGGILADNAGYQSIMAGDVGGGLVSKGMQVASRVTSSAAKMGFKAGTSILGGAGTALGLTTKADSLKKSFSNMGQAMRDKGGIWGAAKGGWTTKEQDQQRAQEQEKSADKKDTADFRNNVLSSLANMGGGNHSNTAGNPIPENKGSVSSNTGTGQNSNTSGNSTIPIPPTKNNNTDSISQPHNNSIGNNNSGSVSGGGENNSGIAKTAPIKNNNTNSTNNNGGGNNGNSEDNNSDS